MRSMIRLVRCVRSLRVTVYGTPDSFREAKKIELKRDMASYTAFKVSRIEQIEDAISIISQAHDKKSERKR